MPVTRSGTLYAMATNQNPNNPNPPNQNPNNSNPTSQHPNNTNNPNSSHQNLNTQDTDQPQLQYQVDQIATVMEQLIHQLDVMEERCAREEYGPFNRRGRRAVHRERLGNSDVDAYKEEEGNKEFEDHEPRVRCHRRNMHRGHADHGTGYQPLDELTKRMKVDVPDFFGKLEPNAFEDWSTAIEDYFDWFAVSEDRKVRYVRMKLKGHARAWWGSVEEQLHRTRRPAIYNWEEMKDKLKEKYLPIDYEQMMFEEMLQLRQGSLSVDQFTDRFHELTVRSKVVETKQQTLARYRTGLRNDLRKEMWNAHLIKVEEAYQLALRIEKQLGLSVGRKVTSWDSKSEPVPLSSTQRLPSLRVQTRSGVSGDYKGKAKASNEGPQCYKCKGFGHYVVVCPTRDKKLAFICEKELLVEGTVEDTKEEEIDGSRHSDEEHLSASELPSCVIHRILTGTRKELQANPEWLRTNIFHTRMKHNGRALNVIIDNGSGMNVICEAAIECLGLKTEKHPTSYRISWVSEANSVLVKQRCLVKFSLGKKYVDEAWCDVIPMTVCHMLLGRPWLYDRRVLYDGYANTCSFNF